MRKNSKSLLFHIISEREKIPSDAKGWSAYLDNDRWDDWGKYRTQFYLTVIDPEGEKHGIGQVKIGSRGLKPHASGPDIPAGHRWPDLDKDFTELGEDCFSLGQDEEYYSNLDALGDSIREQVLIVDDRTKLTHLG